LRCAASRWCENGILLVELSSSPLAAMTSPRAGPARPTPPTRRCVATRESDADAPRGWRNGREEQGRRRARSNPADIRWSIRQTRREARSPVVPPFSSSAGRPGVMSLIAFPGNARQFSRMRCVARRQRWGSASPRVPWTRRASARTTRRSARSALLLRTSAAGGRAKVSPPRTPQQRDPARKTGVYLRAAAPRVVGLAGRGCGFGGK